MDLRKRMDEINRLRREICELEGKLNSVEYQLNHIGVPQIKLKDGFLQIWDDDERDSLDDCVNYILKRRIDIFQNQIDEKLEEAKELL